MSKYAHQPLSFHGLKTVPIQARGGKVRVEHFAKALCRRRRSGLAGFPSPPPGGRFPAGSRQRTGQSARRERNDLWGLGGHVIKCGLAPILIDLMRRGYATAFALNGAAAIHDFEIAIAGQTSEDVEAVLPTVVSARRKRPAVSSTRL